MYLVTRSFQQKYGHDYEETFVPVAHMHIVSTFVTIVAIRGCIFHHHDVKDAILHGDLKEVVYITPPLGLQVLLGSVCHFHRTLYALK